MGCCVCLCVTVSVHASACMCQCVGGWQCACMLVADESFLGSSAVPHPQIAGASFASGNGCTWPGAQGNSGVGAYNPAAGTDDGSCQCAPLNLTWSLPMNTGAVSYMRTVDPQNTLTPVRLVNTDMSSLIFYNGTVSANVTTMSCSQSTLVTASNLTQRLDSYKPLATRTGTQAAHNRPSTSWGAYTTVNVVKMTVLNVSATNTMTQYTNNQTLLCGLALNTNYTAGSGNFLTVTSGIDRKQCVGYYTVGLTVNDSSCALYTDTIQLNVKCPQPTLVQILANSNLLWNAQTGSFVSNPTDTTTGVLVDTSSMNISNTAAYTLSITSSPDPVTYPGVGPSVRACGR